MRNRLIMAKDLKKSVLGSLFGENQKKLPLFIDYLIEKTIVKDDENLFKKNNSKKLNTTQYILKNNHKSIHPLFIKES